MTARSLAAFFALAAAGAVLSGQTDVRAARGGRQELVITNQNLGLVLESRTVTLPAGPAELSWPGAPASARTETWTVTNAAEAGVRWLGLTSPLPGTGESEWLAGLVGRRVRIVRPGGSTAEGEVLAVHGPTPAQVLFREGGELVYGEPDARLSFTPEAGAADRPAAVVLKLESSRAGSRTLTSRYLVSDVGWEARLRAHALARREARPAGRVLHRGQPDRHRLRACPAAPPRRHPARGEPADAEVHGAARRDDGDRRRCSVHGALGVARLRDRDAAAARRRKDDVPARRRRGRRRRKAIRRAIHLLDGRHGGVAAPPGRGAVPAPDEAARPRASRRGGSGLRGSRARSSRAKTGSSTRRRGRTSRSRRRRRST